MSGLKRWLGLFLMWLPLLTGAVGGVVFTPQGEAPRARQARAVFPEAAVRFGDPRLAAPFDIDCSEAGSGRWVDERTWVYDFARALPAGVNCGFRLKRDFRLLSGMAPAAGVAFRFHTGGPAVSHIHPNHWQALDEEQIFLLELSGPATEASMLAHAYCEAEGINERPRAHHRRKRARRTGQALRGGRPGGPGRGPAMRAPPAQRCRAAPGLGPRHRHADRHCRQPAAGLQLPGAQELHRQLFLRAGKCECRLRAAAAGPAGIRCAGGAQAGGAIQARHRQRQPQAGSGAG